MKKCPTCGVLSMDSAGRCDCGFDFGGETPEAGQMFAAVSRPEGPRGVAGWLLLLCVMLAIVTPLLSALAFAVTALAALSGQVQTGSLKTLLVADCLSYAVGGSLAAYAGARLWQLDRRGPGLARLSLLVNLGLALVLVPLPYLFGAPSALAGALAGDRAKDVVRLIPGTILWLTYLRNSKRVRATYGDD